MNTKDSQVRYEQCPWDQKHVESIYRNLAGQIQADGKWHDFPNLPHQVGKYRVYRQSYFQAIYASSYNPLFEATLKLDPVLTQDDAEWTIWQFEEGYGITSMFAYTPGPFEHQEEVLIWLSRHGLSLEAQECNICGVAYFAELESGCLSDAISRLNWLELALRDLNAQYERMSQQFWARVKRESDSICRQHALEQDSTEIVPVPNIFQKSGWKRREAILPPMATP